MIAILKRTDPKSAWKDYDQKTTKHYTSFARLYRYAIRPTLKAWNGRLTAEIWEGDKTDGKPSRVMTWNTDIFK